MSRRLRYQVAVSLDGFIAGPGGEYDWIVMDPSIDFGALFKQFDTLVMGRKTYEPLIAQGGHGAMPGVDIIVFSRTLPAATHKGVRIVRDDPREVVSALKTAKGRDIWLFGGGQLFRTLLDAGLVDSVELAVMPVLLGQGIPMLPPGDLTTLELVDHKILPGSGIAVLAYSVPGGQPAPPIGFIKTKTRSKKRAAARTKAVKKPAAKKSPRRR
jgi:dihydrofolate reductase